MKHFVNHFHRLLLLLLLPLLSFSQTAYDDIEMADVMRANGKIYVVVAVLLIIFIGLAAFLISIDKKVKRLEEKKTNP